MRIMAALGSAPRALWVALIASALCGRASAQKNGVEAVPMKPDGGAAAAAVDVGFAASLRKAAGGVPVLLASVNDAVEARSADGKLKLLIAPAPIEAAVYDAELELLWVRRRESLEVWDLREIKPRAIPIVVEMGDLAEFSIERGSHHVGPEWCMVSGTLRVSWSKRPSLQAMGLDGDEVRPPPRLVGSAWLVDELDRPLRSVSLTRSDPTLGESTRVPLPRKVAACPDPQDCGRAVPFGSTGFTLVTASEESGDCEHYRCLLFDPRTKRFGKPPLPDKWSPKAQKSMLAECGLYHFEPGGKWFAIDDRICAVKGACATLGDSVAAIGWLDGEHDVGTYD